MCERVYCSLSSSSELNFPNYISQLQQQGKLKEIPLLEAEVLQVHAPPFVSKETSSSHAIGPAFSRVQRRKSFIKKVLVIFCFIIIIAVFSSQNQTENVIFTHFSSGSGFWLPRYSLLLCNIISN